MKKKLFMLLLAAFLVLGVAACNGDETSTTTEEPTTTVSETTEDSSETTTTELAKEYPTGFYNFKFADTDLRRAFFGAAERYLLDTLAGGVPMFANAGFALYSNRMTLPVEDYVPVMGFGVSFGSMTADDSTVDMANGDPGEAGVYTYRTTLTGNPETLNQWLYEGSVTSDLMDMYMDALYVYEFNDDKTGYDVVPSMATDMPQPEDPEVLDSGKEVSKVWQIGIRNDLEWYFHPDTLAEQGVDPSTFTDTTIDANDFVDTYKYAIDNDWFRAISGGGDFFAPSQRIKNAEAYYTDPNATPWSEVGIKVIDDHTMEFEFVNDMSEWNVVYWLSSWVMTPVNFDLYDALGEEAGEDDNPYGTLDPTTIAYNGPYYIDYLEQDKLIRLEKNPNFYDPTKFFYDGYEMQIIEDAAIRFQEFEAGRLDAVGVPTEEYENYKDHPGLKRIPGATTFRLTLNGFGSVEAQQETFPESDYVPEPILGNLNFRKALFFAIDRERLATEVLKTSQPNMYMFSSAYLLDAEAGVPFRATDEGEAVGEGLSPETHGHNPDAAAAYWELAVSEEIAEGNYEAGTASEPTIIPLELHIFSGSEGQALYGQYIKTTFEEVFQSEDNNIQVEVTVSPKDFPGIYFDYMMTGEFDMSTGGISGSTLDAASFLDVFCTDNRGGFTISYGVDTSQPDILVEYTDADGVDRSEYWSYDAIVSALSQEIFISDGMEAEVPAAKLDLSTATPTTVEFTIQQFDSDLYSDITYTVQEYDIATDSYVDVDGMVDIVPSEATVELTGLTPGFEETNYYNYKGDYQVVVDFVYATTEDDKPGTTTSSWWVQPGIIDQAATTTTVNATDATIDLVLDDSDGITRAIDSVTVLNQADYSEVTGASVDFSDPSAISVTGLTAETNYLLVFTFDDGNEAPLEITTPAA